MKLLLVIFTLFIVGCASTPSKPRVINSMPSVQLQCANLNLDKNNEQAVFVGELICEVLTQSYPDLQNNVINILAIEDSPTLNKFSSGKLTFISFFNAKRFIPFSNSGYLIGYSKEKLFNGDAALPQFTKENLKAVLAHELAHTAFWKRITPIGDLGYCLWTTAIKSARAKFERQTDIDAIERGLKSGIPYADELGKYRVLNEMYTDPDKRPYLRKVYYFGEQLRLIEDAALTYNDPELREKFFNKFRKAAPTDIDSIQAVLDKISQKLLTN